MKRLLILLVFLFILGGCSDGNEPDPISCETGFELIEETCQPIEDEPVVCNEGYELIGDDCILIEDPLTCEEGYEIVNEDCVLIEEDPVCETGYELIEEECSKIDYSQTPNPDGYFEFYYGDVIREYLMYQPDTINSNTPIVIAMHGFTSNSFNIQEYSGFNLLAEEHGFVVVYPQGTDDPAPHWNADLSFTQVDDVGFITALIEYLQMEYNLSTENVFATGFSNGGFMTYTLACDTEDTFAAVASVSGLMSGTTWDTCDRTTPMNVLHIHGLADVVVPPDGTMTPFGGWGGAPAIEDMMQYWRELNNTQIEELITINMYTTGYRYTSDSNDHQVWVYLIDEYPHAWPGPSDDVLFDEGFAASELIWEFFSQFLRTE